jgi:outer membrane protein assembly factor BamB
MLAAMMWCLAGMAGAGDWPQWRGPRGDSTSDETGLPVAWGEEVGIDWKVELPQWGTSTPAISGDAIFVTSHQDEKLLLVKLKKATGEMLWTRQAGTGTAQREGENREQKFHRLHNLASPSPVTDGEQVIVHFGTGDLVAYDVDGQELWRHNLAEEHGRYTIWWGHANSPVLFDDLVISVCMQDSQAGVSEDGTLAPSYLVAHDKRTGRQRWKSMRMTGAEAEECDAYTTPVLHRTADRWELVVMGGNQLDAYDPATGRQLWHLPGLIGGRTVTGPTVGLGMVFCTRGMKGPLVAVRLEGEGKLTRQSIVWQYDQGTPDTCCPVLWGELLFTVADNGMARCFNAYTGQLQWTERLPGEYKASPLAAEGRIYFLNTQGLCTVVSAATRFEMLAENQLDDETLASPAVSDGRIYLRGKRRLYAVGN